MNCFHAENVRITEALLSPVARVYGTNSRWLRIRTADYFGTVDFSNKNMLDIGAGIGLYTCCAASLGAARVVALEPEVDGSTKNAVNTFQENVGRIGLKNIEFHNISLQNYEAPPRSFDFIFMLAVINHIDEASVQTLHNNEKSRSVYRSLLHPLFDWIKPGGKLIISDVSRSHVFSPLIRLGILQKHPFQPKIKWERHQPPKVWKALLEEIGFTPVHFHWATNWRYSWMPRFLVDNTIAAHVYSSLFVLHAQRPL